MLEIKKRYVVDEQDRRVAVQIDLETFARIEVEILSHLGDRPHLRNARSTSSAPVLELRLSTTCPLQDHIRALAPQLLLAAAQFQFCQ